MSRRVAADVIQAAQEHDRATRPPHLNWRQVDDSQVGRLIEGALPVLARRVTRRVMEHMHQDAAGSRGRLPLAGKLRVLAIGSRFEALAVIAIRALYEDAPAPQGRASGIQGAVEAAIAAERERIALLAERADAFYDAPCPDGDPGCVHQDTPFADLIRDEANAPRPSVSQAVHAVREAM